MLHLDRIINKLSFSSPPPLPARHCAKCFTRAVSNNVHKNTMKAPVVSILQITNQGSHTYSNG